MPRFLRILARDRMAGSAVYAFLSLNPDRFWHARCVAVLSGFSSGCHSTDHAGFRVACVVRWGFSLQHFYCDFLHSGSGYDTITPEIQNPVRSKKVLGNHTWGVPKTVPKRADISP